MRARPARFSDSTGLRLCGIAEEPFWPGGEELLGLQHFGALQMADFGRQPLDRGGDDAERREIHGVAVARDDLRRDRLDRKPHLLRRHTLRRADRPARRCRPRRKSRRSRPPCAPATSRVAGAREFGKGDRELEPEGRRLGMDAVRAADGRREFVFAGAPLERRDAARRRRRSECRRRAPAAR